jgi:hypothetical protein
VVPGLNHGRLSDRTMVNKQTRAKKNKPTQADTGHRKEPKTSDDHTDGRRSAINVGWPAQFVQSQLGPGKATYNRNSSTRQSISFFSSSLLLCSKCSELLEVYTCLTFMAIVWSRGIWVSWLTCLGCCSKTPDIYLDTRSSRTAMTGCQQNPTRTVMAMPLRPW